MTVFQIALVGALALYSLYSLRKKLMPGNKTKLSIQLDVADYNRIRVFADQNGMTLSDYVRNTLMSSVPAEDTPMQGDEKKSVMDVAFEALEAEDQFDTGSGGVMPLPPMKAPVPAAGPLHPLARKPQRGAVITEANRTHPMQRVTAVQPTRLPVVPPGPHPCVHLSSTTPANMRGQCQGTCDCAQQRGRACFWPPTSARSCQYFEAKRGADRNRMSGTSNGNGNRAAPR